MSEAVLVHAGNDGSETFKDGVRVFTAPTEPGHESLSSGHLIGNEPGAEGPPKSALFGNGEHSGSRNAGLFQMQTAKERAARARRAKEVFETMAEGPVVHAANDEGR